MKLTVIMRDDSPMIHCDDHPTFRSVSINLTQEQCEKLALRKTGTAGGKDLFESISICFIEPTTRASGDYPEDGEQYENECCVCGKRFFGHKLRGSCKSCLKPQAGGEERI